MNRRIAPLLLLAAALTLTGCSTAGPDAPVPGGAEMLPGAVPSAAQFASDTDDPAAPRFDAELVDGTPVSGSELWDGRAVLLSFSASWCGSCAENAPMLDALAEQYGDALSIVTVAGDDDPAALDATLRQTPPPGPVIRDSELTLWRAYAVVEPPAFTLIDHEGRVTRMWPGGTDKKTLETALEGVITAH